VIREVGVLRSRASSAGKRLATLTLQTSVRFSSPDKQHAFAQELAQSVAELVARYHDEHAPTGRRFRVIAGAYPASSSDFPESTEQHEEP
jgi:hypothetical protein